MWSAQAQAEGLTLLVTDNKTGYYGVSLNSSSKLKPYEAKVSRSGKLVHLGRFATAEEAALSVARSPEGRAAAGECAAEVAPLTSEEARQQAQEEGLTLRFGDGKAGYTGVKTRPGKRQLYSAQLRRGDKIVHLGCFDTAEEAALCVARCEFEAANEAKRQAVASVRASATPEEVHEMAGHEKLQLKKRKSYISFSGVHPVPITSNSGTGFKGWFVSDEPRVLGRPKYFEAVEAALVVARTREHRKQNPGCTQYPPEMLVVNPTGVRQLRPIITESQYTASPATPDGVPVAHGYLPPMA